MHVLYPIAKKERTLSIGLMSGTSADGIDAALCALTGSGASTKVSLLAFITLPYPVALRTQLLALADGSRTDSETLCRMQFLLGELFAGLRRDHQRTAWTGQQR